MVGFGVCGSSIRKPPRLVHQRMIEGGGIGVEGRGFDAELAAGFAPADDGGEDFAQDSFGCGGFEAES